MLDGFVENIKKFFKEKRLVAILVSIGIFLFFTAFIVMMIQMCPAKKIILSSEQFTPDQELVIPDGVKTEKDYYPYRETEESWNDEEIKKWFTKPDGRSLEQLQKANDSIASDITGAAP